MKKLIPLLAVFALISCDPETAYEYPLASESLELSELASILSELPLENEHFREVHDAVCSSSDHGYDEEYTMSLLFESPGCGVGESYVPTRSAAYSRPLRTLISEYLGARTRSGDAPSDPEAFIESLKSSDVQIYWPYSEIWDGKTAPVITFDPGTGASVNIGYELTPKGINTLLVDEEMAMNRPVWVINRNDDAAFKSIEMLRREDPDWAQGGSVTVSPTKPGATKVDSGIRTLVLKNFRMKRHYDPWFAGASEFFVKCGSVENFVASTEAELKLYTPQITDFMIVVKRSQLGLSLPFNAVLVSEWTGQLDSFAFMIVEDDGGTRTSWDCSCIVKIESKSYGVDVKIPFRTSDDIVWRGQLSSRYFEKDSEVRGHFGDVDLSFAFE